MVIYLINWIKQLLKENMPAAKKKKKVSKTMIKISGLNRLDERFRIIFFFTDLKTFPSFAEVKQWTGVEQKAIIRQIISVVIPLLKKKMAGGYRICSGIDRFCSYCLIYIT